eukprot:15213592-Alexandrium_andersonii.AAC.1
MLLGAAEPLARTRLAAYGRAAVAEMQFPGDRVLTQAEWAEVAGRIRAHASWDVPPTQPPAALAWRVADDISAPEAEVEAPAAFKWLWLEIPVPW